MKMAAPAHSCRRRDIRPRYRFEPPRASSHRYHAYRCSWFGDWSRIRLSDPNATRLAGPGGFTGSAPTSAGLPDQMDPAADRWEGRRSPRRPRTRAGSSVPDSSSRSPSQPPSCDPPRLQGEHHIPVAPNMRCTRAGVNGKSTKSWAPRCDQIQPLVCASKSDHGPQGSTERGIARTGRPRAAGSASMRFRSDDDAEGASGALCLMADPTPGCTPAIDRRPRIAPRRRSPPRRCVYSGNPVNRIPSPAGSL